MIRYTEKQCSKRNGQEGFVLVVVFTLILLISALGLLAMRHARQEARSTGAYVDSTVAIALAESAMAMAITDLRRSPDYYQIEFNNGANESPTATNLFDVEYAIKLDEKNFSEASAVESAADNLCDGGVATADEFGCVPLLSSPHFEKGGGSDDLYPGADFWTTLTYSTPLVGPCPPGYSCFDDQNYGWYVFGINVTARYGAEGQWIGTPKFIEHGRAVASGRVTIGPIGVYGR